jgi:SAM-dependent methyltransferase
MLSLRYIFDSFSFSDSNLACSLASELSQCLALKLEALGPVLKKPELYAHFAKPLLHPQFSLHTDPNRVADPATVNLYWGISPVLAPTKDSQCDQIWAMTTTALTQLETKHPEQAVKHLPVCCDLADWQKPEAPPADLELEAGQRLLLWQAANAQDLSLALAAFIPLATEFSDCVLVLQLEQVAEDFEDNLIAEIEQLCAQHGVADKDNLNIHTLIGKIETPALKGLIQSTNVFLAPNHPLLALAARALGKQVLAWAETVEKGWGCHAWSRDSKANTQALRTALATPATPLSASVLALHTPAAISAKMLAYLKTLASDIDIPARRAQAQAERLERHAAAREGRKQKYSLFHSDYQGDELKARRAWHERYAAYFMAAPGEIVDIGSGSGIFLEILRDVGVPAFGVDPDPDMVDVCLELGLQALHGDERILADCDENSLGGIHASHIIEHVDGQRAIALVENALIALRPGGLLLIRTPNWRNTTVRQEGFWLDITHIRPYPLPLLEQVLKDAGFEVVAGGFEEFGWNDTFIVGRKPPQAPSETGEQI